MSRWSTLLVLVLCGFAWGSPRVEIALRNGERVAGELIAFEARVFRVQLADGSLRALEEPEVRVVRFLERAVPSTLEGVLGEALRAARASGALQRDVLGERHYQLTETRRVADRFSDDSGYTNSVEQVTALRVEITDTSAGLCLEVERRPLGVVLPTPDEGPAVIRCWVNAKGQVTRWTLNTPVDSAELLATEEGYALQGEGRWFGASTWAVGEGAFPQELVRFVCLPLAELGFPGRFEVAAWGAAGPQRGGLTCERLPGTEFRDGELVFEARLLEAELETSLWVGGEGDGDRRLRGWRTRSTTPGSARAVQATPIDAAAYAALLAQPGVLPAPPDVAPALRALAPALAPAQVQAWVGTRTYEWTDDLDGRLWLGQVSLERVGHGFVCDVVRHSAKRSNQARTRALWTHRGLAALQVQYPIGSEVLHAVLYAEATGWVRVSGQARYYRELPEAFERTACAAPPAGAVPRELTRFLLDAPAPTFAEDAWLLGLDQAAVDWGPRHTAVVIDRAVLAQRIEAAPEVRYQGRTLMREALARLSAKHAESPGVGFPELVAAAELNAEGFEAPFLLTRAPGEAWAAEARTRLPSSEPEALRSVPGGRPERLEKWLVAQ